MKTTMFAVLHNGRTGEDVKKVEICNVILDEYRRMSGERYNKLKREMEKLIKPAPKAHYWRLETAEGLQDTFGGYPAEVPYVRFEKVDE